HFVDLVIRGGPVVRQFFTRLNVSHGHEHDLPLYADIAAAREIAEDHPPFALVFSHRADEEAGLIVIFGECGTGLQSNAIRPLSLAHADSWLIFCCKYQDM